MGRTLNPERMAQIGDELAVLLSACKGWLAAWRVLPDDLDAVDRFVSVARATGEEGLRARAADVSRVIAPIATRSRAGDLRPADLDSLVEEVRRLVDREKGLADHRADGSLYSVLHSRLDNHVRLIRDSPPDIARRAEYIQQLVRGGSGPGLEDLDGLLAGLSHAAIARNPEALADASAGVAAALEKIPRAPVHRRELDPSTGEAFRWTVLCVDDDALVWGGKLERTIHLIRLKLGAGHDVRYQPATDRESAEQHLARASRADRSDHRLVAVLDLCLPARAGADASRDEGISLLRHCRSPKHNVPVIVLTTAPNFLGDHRLAAELGVSDYLLKDVDSEERLSEAVLRLVQAKPRRALQLFEDTGTLVRVDDVDVQLSPAVFRTLDVLAAESYQARRPVAVTPERIAEVERRLHGVAPTLGSEDDPYATTLRLHWAAANARVDDAEEAVRSLFDDQLPLRWRRSLEKELFDAGISPADRPRVAGYMEARYGGAEIFEGVNVQKRVSEARRAIVEAFNAAGRGIVPEEEVITNDHVLDSDGESRFAYKIVAKIRYRKLPPRRDIAQFGVLVVDDDGELWRRPIQELLELHGYDVRSAGCADDALELAREQRPDVLCLDMHFPWDRATFQREPTAGKTDAGLRLLKEVRSFLPNVRAVVLSAFTDSDAIRDRAVQLGVRVSDFVPKDIVPANSWQTQLVLKIHRIEQEIRRGAVMPLPNVSRLPYLYLRRSDPRHVEVFGRRWRASENQSRLLWVLAERAGDPVAHKDILAAVWPNDREKIGALKNLVNRFRNEIQRDWFGISDEAEGKALREAILANVNKVCYVLNARVQIDD